MTPYTTMSFCIDKDPGEFILAFTLVGFRAKVLIVGVVLTSQIVSGRSQVDKQTSDASDKTLLVEFTTPDTNTGPH